MGDRGRVGRLAAVGLLTSGVALAAVGLLATATHPPGENPYRWPQFVIGLSGVGVGAYVARRVPRHPLGWLLLVAGWTSWLTFAGQPSVAWLMIHAPGQRTLASVVLAISVSGWLVTEGVMLALVPQAFPDGFDPHPRWMVLRSTATAAIAVTALCHSKLWTFDYFAGRAPTGLARWAERIEPWGYRTMIVVGVPSMVAMVVASARSARAERRRRAGFTVAVLVLLVPVLADLARAVVSESLPDLSSIEVWALAALPVVLAVGVVRHQLLDIRVAVRRASIYVAVTATVSAIYLAVVWVVATLTDAGRTTGAVVAAGAVAVSFGAVRDGTQRLVARRLFGRRDDPYAVLAALGARLEASPRQDGGLQVVTDTITAGLRIPFAAIELDLDSGTRRVAATGRPSGAPEVFDLRYQGTRLGSLLVERRTPGEPLNAAETQLLGELARQSGVLAHNAALVEELRQARTVLVRAREEERRRIRADLHDGLGPTLASLALGLEATADRLAGDPELAAFLADLERELQTAIADLRALVYHLRPAALDDAGLVAAVEDHARAITARSADGRRPLDVSVHAPDPLGPLPAAVEVAAYRVALEAMTNVARHAHASMCRVELGVDRGRSGAALWVRVSDDGVGLPADARPGVGLRSMRERVSELGGELALDSGPEGGMTIRACLPLDGVIASVARS